VLTRDEVRRLRSGLQDVPRLVAALLHRAGLRLLECLELRVKDIDVDRREITIRRGKGGKDRVTVPLDTGGAAVRSPARGQEDARG
jgi:integrase